MGEDDGRTEFVDVPFLALDTVSQISGLDGTVVFVNVAAQVPTKSPAFVIIHNPPLDRDSPASIATMLYGRTLITPSKYAARLWADYTKRPIDAVHIAYPFAEPCFGIQLRQPQPNGVLRVLFAGRLSAQKGIYTFLEMLHMPSIQQNPNIVFSVTTAGADKPEGQVIKMLLDAHPRLAVVSSCKTSVAMANLMAQHDIVVMPSNSQYWHETFGIVSIEAQHAGLRVVASNDGGLPETDCGGVLLIKPDDAEALAIGITEAMALGPLSPAARRKAAGLFTVEQSVDNLLLVLYPADSLVAVPVKKIVLRSSLKAPL
jgi:D-inositol-3-phosphate glycosyltransferase